MAKSSIEKYKYFEKWKTQEVENEFGLVRYDTNVTFLQDFLSNPVILTDDLKKDILQLRVQLRTMIEAWNEYDMSILFIGPLFNIVQSQERRIYRTFFNHSLKTILNNKEIAGRVDGMLAKGWQIPSVPLFFMQEYKAESGPNGDPLGQLLIEMVAAQALNNEPEQTLYGCYIIGRNWFFVVLQGKDYAVSFAYDATQNDIFDIVGILKKIKKLFEIKIGYVAEK
jgi:hypothetical protein